MQQLDQFLKQWRADTPATQNIVHLNNAGAALMPQPVLEAMVEHLRLEAALGGYEAAEKMNAQIQQSYQLLATLLNTAHHNIAIGASATDAYNRALSAIPFQTGDTILTTDNDYASNQIAFLSLEKRFGVNTVRMPQNGAHIDLDAATQMMETMRPKLVSVTHVPTNSGLIQPIEAIGKICRELGIWYLVDACQSAGQMPLNVQAIHCDFLSATYRKFLRGPRGLGFLYVSDRALKAGLAPLYLDMRGADWIAPNAYNVNPSAHRFEDWEFAYALIMGGNVAVQYALDIGLDKIQNRVFELAKYTRTRLQQIDGVQVLDQGQHLAGIVTFHLDGADAMEIKLALRGQGINVSAATRVGAVIDFDKKGVTGAVRVSPHYYNTTEEIDVFIDRLKAYKSKA
jgi:selenocysteine lyase/cysteine desulfurase